MNKLILLISILALTGCSTAPIEIKSKAIKKQPLVLAPVDEYTPHNVKWMVVTKKNVQELLDKEIVLFAVNTKSYEGLAHNTASIRKLIEQLLAQNKSIKVYYETKSKSTR